MQAMSVSNVPGEPFTPWDPLQSEGKSSPGWGTKPTPLEVAERQAKVLNLYRAGVTSYRRIAAALGCSHQTVKNYLRRALADLQREQKDVFAHAVAIESARLDKVQEAFWERAARGDVGAANLLLKVVARRCRLLGLDAPERRELTGKDGGPVEFAELSHEERLRRLAAILGADEACAS